MHNRIIDLTGQTFTRLTVIEFIGRRKGRTLWKCKCSCGKDVVADSLCLKYGSVKSCGCYKIDLAKSMFTKHGYAKLGAAYSPELKAWNAMKERCYNKNCKMYKNYGGRGIVVCDRWIQSFDNFLSDMGFRPNSKMSLHRINNDKNYELSNCMWATRKIQGGETSRSRWIEYDGKRMILQDWANLFNIDNSTLFYRIKMNSVKEAFDFSKENINKGRSMKYKSRKLQTA